MSITDEANEYKEYIERLKSVIIPDPRVIEWAEKFIEESDKDDEFREVFLAQFKFVIPLAHAYICYYEYHIPDLMKGFELSYLEGTKNARVSRSELFEMLTSMSIGRSSRLVRSLHCDINTQDDLIDAISEKDEHLFSRTLREGKCDYSILSFFMYNLKCAHERLYMQEKEYLFLLNEADLEEDEIIAFNTTSIRSSEDVGVPSDAIELERRIGKTLSEEDVDDPQLLADLFVYRVAYFKILELSKQEKSALSPIFDSEEFIALEKRYKTEIEQWKNKILGDAEESDDSQAHTEELIQQNPVASQDVASEVKKSGRPIEKWWKDEKYDEDTVKKIIYNKVLPPIIGELEELTIYTSRGKRELQGPQRKEAIHRWACAFAVIAAIDCGFADDVEAFSSPMERTFCVSRSSMKDYYTPLKIYKELLTALQKKGKIDKTSIKSVIRKRIGAFPNATRLLEEHYTSVFRLLNNATFIFGQAFKIKVDISYIQPPEKSDPVLGGAVRYNDEVQLSVNKQDYNQY